MIIHARSGMLKKIIHARFAILHATGMSGNRFFLGLNNNNN